MSKQMTPYERSIKEFEIVIREESNKVYQLYHSAKKRKSVMTGIYYTEMMELSTTLRIIKKWSGLY